MAVLFSFPLMIFVAVYTLLATNTVIFQRFSGRIPWSGLIHAHQLRSDIVFAVIAIATFSISFGSIFVIRNSDLMIGSKKTLLAISLISIVCAGILGYQIVQRFHF